ncbi:MAG: hypothetical protein KA734_01090 [Fluviicola sp.]|nr:hypothetical protein [Fluviicola sp.]MBP6074257.1 hypothetical protein [Flavobacterium sp.]
MPNNEEIDPEILEYYQRLAQEQQLQRKSRINPTTGQLEYWSQPPGLPGIWLTPGFCSRCQPYKKYFGLSVIEEEDWKKLSHLQHESEELMEAATSMGYELKSCGE